MNIYVVPEIDIERFKETGVFAVRLLNNEAMTHDGIYLESDRAKEFAEFFKDNIIELGCDYGPYAMLADAASEAGICALNFPFKTTMFLSEKEGVVVRDGYGAPPVRI